MRVEVRDAEGTLVASGSADSRGRIDPLAGDLSPGTYRVEWDVGGDLIASLSATVHLAEDRHYHLPLVASGFAASVYLGA